jgi:hypothetical protein
MGEMVRCVALRQNYLGLVLDGAGLGRGQRLNCCMHTPTERSATRIAGQASQRQGMEGRKKRRTR